MATKKPFFNLIAAQRYFHFVAFKFNKTYSAQQYWRECGETKEVTTFESDTYKIEYANFVSHDEYYNGSKVDYSVNLNHAAPFHYDLFCIEIKQSNTFILGFPFQTLAKKIIDAFIKKHYDDGYFVKADLRKMVKANTLVNDNDEFFARFSGVELKLTGDLNITSVNLDGDKPLESDLYKEYFKEHIENDNIACKVEKCAVKLGIVSSDLIPLSAANIHLDLFGNFKIYIHGSGNNVFTLPYLFEIFKSIDSLNNASSSSNPINRVKKNE